MSKKYFRKTLWGYIAMLVLFVVGFWWGSGYLFTEDYYYPKIIMLCSMGFVAAVFQIIFHLFEYFRKRPIAVITSNGISFNGKPFRSFGEVKWQDVADYKEMAIDRTGRKLLFYVKNNTDYTNKVNSFFQKRRLKKELKNNGNALAFIETKKMDCDLPALKNTISNLVNKQL